jgi:hypothetical protein
MGSERGRAHAHMYLSDFTGTFIYIYKSKGLSD